MARTALDLISASLKRLNVLAGIETPSADLAEDALQRLNDLLETWTTESLTIYALTTIGKDQIFVPPPPAAGWYSIGPGGVIEITQRPPWVESVSFLHTGGTPSPIEQKLTRFTQAEWEYKTDKLATSTQPTHFYYSPQYPLGQLFLWPMLSGGSFGMWIYIPIPVGPYLFLTSEIDLPQGYFRAVRDNLAIELAPELGVQVPDALQFSARDALAQLKRTNFRPRVLGLPANLPGMCHGAYNVWTDE